MQSQSSIPGPSEHPVTGRWRYDVTWGYETLSAGGMRIPCPILWYLSPPTPNLTLTGNWLLTKGTGSGAKPHALEETSTSQALIVPWRSQDSRDESHLVIIQRSGVLCKENWPAVPDESYLSQMGKSGGQCLCWPCSTREPQTQYSSWHVRSAL